MAAVSIHLLMAPWPVSTSGFYEWCCCEHLGTSISVDVCFVCLGQKSRDGIAGSDGNSMLAFPGPSRPGRAPGVGGSVSTCPPPRGRACAGGVRPLSEQNGPPAFFPRPGSFLLAHLLNCQDFFLLTMLLGLFLQIWELLPTLEAHSSTPISVSVGTDG